MKGYLDPTPSRNPSGTRFTVPPRPVDQDGNGIASNASSTSGSSPISTNRRRTTSAVRQPRRSQSVSIYPSNATIIPSLSSTNANSRSTISGASQTQRSWSGTDHSDNARITFGSSLVSVNRRIISASGARRTRRDSDLFMDDLNSTVDSFYGTLREQYGKMVDSMKSCEEDIMALKEQLRNEKAKNQALVDAAGELVECCQDMPLEKFGEAGAKISQLKSCLNDVRGA